MNSYISDIESANNDRKREKDAYFDEFQEKVISEALMNAS